MNFLLSFNFIQKKLKKKFQILGENQKNKHHLGAKKSLSLKKIFINLYIKIVIKKLFHLK